MTGNSDKNDGKSLGYWRIFCLCALAMIVGAVSLPSWAASPSHQTIMGKISIVDSDASPEQLTVEIGGSSSKIAKNGHYSVKVQEADSYQLRFRGEGVFESVQTFAHIELVDAGKSALKVPPIELVAKKKGRVELVFGGDVMMGRRYLKPRFGEHVLIRPDTRAADMEKLVMGMQPYFKPADYSAVNLETILAKKDPGKHAPKSVVFYTHPQVLEALKTMGADYVSLGNNHTFDYLDEGLKTTLDALDKSGLGNSGAGFDEKQALAPYRTTIKGNDYSMLGYVGWAGRVKPNQVAEANKGGAALGTEDNIRASVGREAAIGRVTVVQYHGNSEYSEAPTPRHERRLRAAIDAGADLVVGHHPHVTHGLEVYNGKLIAWSLGNFMFDQFFISTHAAYALKVWMDGEEFYRAEIIPVHMRDYRPMPAMADVRRHILQRVFTQSAKRGTYLTMSGGHGVIAPSGKKAMVRKLGANVKVGQKGIVPLPITVGPNNSFVAAMAGGKRIEDVTFGRDLLLRGDFESYGLQGVKERTWGAANGSFKLAKSPRSGRYAMEYQIKEGATSANFGLKTFTRVLLQDNYSFTGWIKPQGRMKVSAFVQYRPSGMNRYTALASSKFHKLGDVTLDSGNWQEFAFDVKAEKAKNKKSLPMRMMLKFEPLDGKAKQLLLDDVALIGWENEEQAKLVSAPNRRTHVMVR